VVSAVAGRTGLAVAQVTADLEIGGAQEMVHNLAKYLPRVGCPTVVCTFADGPLRPEIERLGVEVEVLPGRRHSALALPLFLVEMARLRGELVRLVDRHGIDVVHTHGLGTLDFLVMTLRFGDVSQVWWTIENTRFMVRREHLPCHPWLLRPKRWAHRRLYRVVAGVVNGVIAVSDETARSFRRLTGLGRDGDRGSDRITVVCNAVDLERFPAVIDRDLVRAWLGFGPEDHLMTMVGTFKRQKGHAILVEAVAGVAARFPGLHVLLVGDGELAGDVRAQVKAAGLAERVHLLGAQREVPQLLAASDSFVLPSLWEGLPVALVEAMASELPIVATAVSGTSQVMEDGVTGWLVPPGDPAALAAAMADLLANPERAAARAAAGRTRVATAFSARRQAEQLVDLFRRAAPAAVPHGRTEAVA
jgi:glycosyltransferase involved in cell wall biosynthesis